MQAWRMPDGPSWDHPMSLDPPDRPWEDNLYPGNLAATYRLADGREITIKVADLTDGDALDAHLLDAMTDMGLIPEPLSQASIQWEDAKHATLTFFDGEITTLVMSLEEV